MSVFSVYLFYMNSEWLKVKSLQIHIIIHRNSGRNVSTFLLLLLWKSSKKVESFFTKVFFHTIFLLLLMHRMHFLLPFLKRMYNSNKMQNSLLCTKIQSETSLMTLPHLNISPFHITRSYPWCLRNNCWAIYMLPWHAALPVQTFLIKIFKSLSTKMTWKSKIATRQNEHFHMQSTSH